MKSNSTWKSRVPPALVRSTDARCGEPFLTVKDAQTQFGHLINKIMLRLPNLRRTVCQRS